MSTTNEKYMLKQLTKIETRALKNRQFIDTVNKWIDNPLTPSYIRRKLKAQISAIKKCNEDIVQFVCDVAVELA